MEEHRFFCIPASVVAPACLSLCSLLFSRSKTLDAEFAEVLLYISHIEEKILTVTFNLLYQKE